MRSKTLIALTLAAAAAAALGARYATADYPAEGAARRAINASSHQLYVVMDKPMYRPGETVWLRTWELDGNLRPATSANVSAKLLDPKGSAIIDESLPVSGNMAKAALDLPAGLAGGTYTLELRAASGATEKRQVIVSTYELPEYKKQIEFDKTSYGPGDRVEVSIAVSRSTGEALRRARVSGWVWLDGREIGRVSAWTNATGHATLRFRLPSSMARGDGLLTVVVDHRGATESVQRRIPIAVDAFVIRSFPEGGDLIAGVASRVYFDARDLLGNPLELSGDVVDQAGAVVGKFATDVRGMGIATMTPEAGTRYFFEASLTQKSERRRFEMRPVLASGCALATPNEAKAMSGAEISVQVTCTGDQAIAVQAFVRGTAVASLNARALAGDATTLRLPIGRLQGVVRVMLTAGGRPAAERLIYRGIGRDLEISIRPDREQYQPRDRVKLALETRSPDGAPVAADLALAVVDETVFEAAGDKTGHILSKLYLEPELPGQTIDDPNFYFGNTPESRRGLDLLLGTKGWRRFR